MDRRGRLRGIKAHPNKVAVVCSAAFEPIFNIDLQPLIAYAPQ